MKRTLETAAALLGVALAALAPASADPQAAYQDLSWRLLGPLRAGWSIVAEGVPDEPDTFYFGAADGGVWKTTDAGNTWQPIADSAPFSSVGGLAVVVAGERRLLYVGSGQTQTRHDVMDGTGVYKSEDDGRTWTSLGLADTLHIGRIWVDPRNPDVVLVAALGHLFGPNAERGVFRSADGGKTWAKVAFVDADTGAVDLAADAQVPDTVYAAFWQVRRYPWQAYHVPQSGPGSGIWKSTDGGKTWAATARQGLPAGPLGRIGLAVAPGTGGRRVYAVVDAADGAGLYRTDDGGASWALMQANRSLVSNYFGRVFADPQNPDVVYFMGQSFRRSDDGGKTLSYVKGSPGGDDYHFLWINPRHHEHMVLASDQGTTVSVNGGATWSSWYNQATGQFYRLGVDDGFPYRVYSGQQDNGTVSVASRSDYGQLTFRDWNPVGGDERDGDLPEPTDPSLVYGSGLGGKISRWDARTGRVAVVSPWPIGSYGQKPNTARFRTTWITPIATSPRPPHALYQGTQVLQRSLDKGQSWQAVSPDLTGAVAGEPDCEKEPPISRATACGYGVIYAISPSPAADGVIWVGTDNGRVQLTRDDGSSWRDVTPQGLGDWSLVASVDASASDPASALIAVDRHRLDDRDPYVWVTHDYGASWRRADTGLPRGSSVNVVREDPARRGLLYAGTRKGVWVSFDDGASWQSLELNLPPTAINDLVVHGKDLLIATQGRALWVLDDVTPLRQLVQPGAGLRLAAPAPAYRLGANENRDTPLPPEFPTTPNPPTGAVLDYLLPQAPAGPVRIEVFDASGTPVRSFASDAPPVREPARQYFHERWLKAPAVPGSRAGHNRFVWNLRLPQPQATDYDFSIAAVPDRDTPVVPQGALVLPGTYRVRLTVDGTAVEQPLEVLADPRGRASLADMASQLAFLSEVNAALARAAEALQAAEGLASKLGVIAGGGNKRLAAEAARVQEALEKAHGGGGASDLGTVGTWLSTLSVDLESADGPPTGPQRQLYTEAKANLELALKAWQAAKAMPSKALARELAKAE